MKTMNEFPAGDAGWGVAITNARAGVEVSITGPQSGWYPGDWMTPEQAEAIGLGIIHAAQAAREKAQKPNHRYPAIGSGLPQIRIDEINKATPEDPVELTDAEIQTMNLNYIKVGIGSGRFTIAAPVDHTAV